jgi:HSP20 family protein
VAQPSLGCITHQEELMSALIQRRSLFDDFFRELSPGFYVKPLHGDPLPDPSQIRIEVKDRSEAFTVAAELPGVRKEDIHITVEDNVVTLSAEVKQSDEQQLDGQLLRSERFYGSVSRSFALPQSVDATQSKAKFDNGVLTLELPKLVTQKSNRVMVQ